MVGFGFDRRTVIEKGHYDIISFEMVAPKNCAEESDISLPFAPPPSFIFMSVIIITHFQINSEIEIERGRESNMDMCLSTLGYVSCI